MNNLVTQGKRDQALVTADDATLYAALRASLYPGAHDDSIAMVLAYCAATNLDPMTKPVHIVPMSVKTIRKKSNGDAIYEYRDVVMPGIELYRTKAHNTGRYAGQDDAEFGPIIEANLGGVELSHPEWCRVTVYRIVGKHRVRFSAMVFFMEAYATASRHSLAPNDMWKRRPFGQLEKCAEALALRKAFPESVGAQPTFEEMDGRTFEPDPVAAVAADLMPRARAPELPAPGEEAQHEQDDAGASQEAAAKPAGATEAAAEPEQPPAVIDLTVSMRKVLERKLKSAGLELDDDGLTERFGSVTKATINAIFAELEKLAAAA